MAFVLIAVVHGFGLDVFAANDIAVWRFGYYFAFGDIVLFEQQFACFVGECEDVAREEVIDFPVFQQTLRDEGMLTVKDGFLEFIIVFDEVIEVVERDAVLLVFDESFAVGEDDHLGFVIDLEIVDGLCDFQMLVCPDKLHGLLQQLFGVHFTVFFVVDD